jgi:hypothetical protein
MGWAIKLVIDLAIGRQAGVRTGLKAGQGIGGRFAQTLPTLGDRIPEARNTLLDLLQFHLSPPSISDAGFLQTSEGLRIP